MLNPLAALRDDVVIRESIVLKTNIEHQLFFKSIHKIRALSGDHIQNHKTKKVIKNSSWEATVMTKRV